MAEDIFHAIRQNGLFLITVIGASGAVIAANLNSDYNTRQMILKQQADIRELRALYQENIARLNQFAGAGQRFTLSDAMVLERELEKKLSDHDRRLTILESGRN